jgi:hypothetical protein
MSFDKVQVGNNQSQRATLTNSGASTVTVNRVTASRESFSVSGLTLPLTLAAGQSQPFSVIFAPQTAGSVDGNLVMVGSGSNPTIDVPLAGNGLAAVSLTANPSSLNFGSVQVGNSQKLSEALTNSGGSSVTFTQAAATSSEFIVSGLSLPVTIPAGKNVHFTVTFAPQASGEASATASFTVDASNSPVTIVGADSNTIKVLLSGNGLAAGSQGTGVAGQLAISPLTVNFGSVTAGSHASQTVKLAATGQSVVVSSATVSSSEFIVSGLSFPVTIPAGKNVQFAATFTPQASGEASATASFALNTSNSPVTMSLSGTGQASAWPALYGKVGAFDLQTPQEVSDMANDGFHLALVGYQGTADALAMALVRNNVQYIDSYPWYEISTLCQPQVLLGNSCTISSEEQQTLLDNIRVHFSIASHDSNVVGYWILDDYPGDIHDLLVSVHALLTEANKTSIVPRPAICGFGGILDWKTNISDTVFNSNTSYFQRSLINFDSNACDIVALYPYEPASIPDANLVDWSMTNLLPQMLVALEDSGWRQDKEPLIGIPQTFGYQGILGYVAPTGKDVSLQSAAYCKAGAIAVLAYAWDDSYQGSKVELFNSTDLVQGLQQGAHECQTLYWK